VKERSFVAEIAFLRLATALPEVLRERVRVPRLLHAAAGLLAPRDGVSAAQVLLVEHALPPPATCAPCGDFAGVGAPLSAIDDARWAAMPPLRPTAFAMLMEDVRFTRFSADGDGSVTSSADAAVVSEQRGGEADGWTLPSEHARSAARWLAALHSIPWRRRGADAAPLWEDGSYWNLSKRRFQLDRDTATRRWSAAWAALDSDAADATRALDWRGGAQSVDLFKLRATSGIATLAARLVDAAPALDRYLYSPRAARTGRSPRTVLHGDLKSENLFFTAASAPAPAAAPEGGRGGSAAAALPRCTAVDFQWTGWGIGPIDLVYLLLTSVGDKRSFPALIEAYVSALATEHAFHCAAAAAARTPPPPPPPTLAVTRAEFDIALLDFARFCVCDDDGVVLADDAWMVREAARVFERLDALDAADYAAAIEEYVACAR
jgi:hypothetical protein